MISFTAHNLAIMLNLDNKGQVFIESLVAIKTFILFFVANTFVIYLLLAHSWCEYWVYQSSLCLAQGHKRWHCQKRLTNKLSIIIPNRNFTIEKLWRTPKGAQSQILLTYQFPYPLTQPIFKKTYSSELQFPLK